MRADQLDVIGYIALHDEGRVEPISYRNYLDTYGRDMTTTPNGVGERIHIRERIENRYESCIEGVVRLIYESDYNDLDEDEQNDYRLLGEVVREWEIWSWGVSGNSPYYFGASFDTLEDAELYCYQLKEKEVSDNWDALWFYESYEDAREALLIK